jgi:hypothetical protein
MPITKIEILFPLPFEPSEGFSHKLHDLLAVECAASYASADAARTATLKKCAEIVRKHYPTLPT